MKLVAFWRPKNSSRNFLKKESGLAMTEYLIILGLLAGGVIGVVSLISGSIQSAYVGWSDGYSDQVVTLQGPEDGGTGGTGTTSGAGGGTGGGTGSTGGGNSGGGNSGGGNSGGGNSGGGNSGGCNSGGKK